jgi:hypothetical protein
MPNLARCPYCTEGGQFKVMIGYDRGDYFTCARCNHISIPGNPNFQCTCSKCVLLDITHEVQNLREIAGRKKAELIFEPTPSGSPILRGSCSSCPRVIFAVVGNTEENRRRMQQAFDKHFQAIHHVM